MRIYKISNLICIALIICFSVTGCGEKAKYESLVERELEKGIRKDSLFLGIHFGMSKKDFYGHCWQLNKKGVIHNGSKNTTVEYKINDLKHPATMNFYPTFHNEKINTMPVIFTYAGWAPWNKKLWSDSLQRDVLNLYKKWYGDDFMEIRNSEVESKVAYLKVDGNRQISIYKANDSDVAVIYTDLLVEKQLKKKEAKN